MALSKCLNKWVKNFTSCDEHFFYHGLEPPKRGVDKSFSPFKGRLISIVMMGGYTTLFAVKYKSTCKIAQTYLFKLLKLCIPKLLQCICVTFLHLAKTHITNTIAHLTHIKKSWSQGLYRSYKQKSYLTIKQILVRTSH